MIYGKQEIIKCVLVNANIGLRTNGHAPCFRQLLILPGRVERNRYCAELNQARRDVVLVAQLAKFPCPEMAEFD